MAMSGKVENATTLPALVGQHAKADPEGVILRRKDRGIWKTVTWADMDARMNAIAAAIRASGLRGSEVAAILSDTNPEWAMLDLGIQAAGCVSAGLNPADGSADVGRQLAETGARLLFVEGEAMLDKALAVRSTCPDLARIVVMDMKGLRDLAEPGCESLEAFLARTAAPGPGATLDPNAPAAIIYTAGTSSPARAVVFSHRNIQAAIAAAAAPLDQRAGDERLAFLPMCHVIERVMGLYLSLATGTVSNYVEGVDTVPENLEELQPTVLIAPPRFWRRLHARVTAATAGAAPEQRWLVNRALKAGLAAAQGRASPIDRLALALGQRLVLEPIRRSLGLARLRRAVFAFGSVPDTVAEWLQGAGIETAELYGQTESGGFGFLLPTGGGDTARLAAAGEIQLRGAHVAMGYRQDGGVTAIATVDGWLCTGDIGQGTDGRIVPTGRLAEGREPASLEAALRASPFISDAVTIATGGPTGAAAGGGHAALVMIDADTVEPWAQRQNIPFTGFASLVRAEAVRNLIAEAVASTNRAGSGTIRAFRLIEQRYEPGDTELSPVFTLRRALIRERHRDVIEAMLREA